MILSSVFLAGFDFTSTWSIYVIMGNIRLVRWVDYGVNNMFICGEDKITSIAFDFLIPFAIKSICTDNYGINWNRRFWQLVS